VSKFIFFNLIDNFHPYLKPVAKISPPPETTLSSLTSLPTSLIYSPIPDSEEEEISVGAL
jgi:hypothetical protein